MPGGDRDPYRRVAGSYDRLFGRLNAGLRGIGLKMFPPRAGMAVLDVGCGTGIQLEGYQRAGCRVFGIDSSPAMIDVARRRLGDRAELHLGDASRMPYPDDRFDLITAATVFHEMPPETREAVLGEMSRTLRGDGQMLFIDFHPGRLRPVRGWLAKGIITVAETLAGRDHHRNYRDFIARGGIPVLVESHGLTIDRSKIVSGGAIGVYLVSLSG